MSELGAPGGDSAPGEGSKPPTGGETTGGNKLPIVKEILAEVENWRAAGKRVALATVVQVYGSAPRPLGAKLAVSEDGAMVGSVSGGCVESAAVQEALEALTSGAPRLVSYGIADETAWEIGLACGGTIEVFIEPLE